MRNSKRGNVMIGNGVFRMISISLTTLLVCGLLLVGCDTNQDETDLAWAVNVGGPFYEGVDGTRYASDTSILRGEIGQLENVLGSQDEFLYQSFREGDIEVARPIENGVYDITFHFAEPDEIEADDRIFDVFAEGRRVVTDLDVMVARDGQIRSALTVTVANVATTDGELNIHFDATAMLPVLSALVVRRKVRSQYSRVLSWSDEFDHEGAPNSAIWNVEEWAPRVVNSEDQAYTARSKNLRVEDGVLVIEAHKEVYDEAEYTSARIQSSGKGDVLYGRVEARAMLPAGQGTWAAIWMLPSNPFTYATTCTDDADWQGSETCDAWPNSGEIDIMEHVGYMMGHIHGTVHNEAYYFVDWQQRKGRILVDDAAEAFHVYALDWSPERIDVFVDDVLYFTYINENDGWQSWPYDQPFHVILNLAIGGNWGRAGGAIDDEIFPVQMKVDYVRAYEFEPPDR